MKSNLQVKERRIRTRKKLTGLLPGKMILESDGSKLDCKPVDLSKNGLGVLIEKELKSDAIVILQLAEQEIKFRIRWCQPDFAKSDRYRYGLLCVDEGVDIEQLFIDKNCYK